MSALWKRVLLCALFTVGMLTVGAGAASADSLVEDGLGSLIEQSQEATNSNSTDQSANAAAETNQVNVNAPISILSWGSNNGDVWQSNDSTSVVQAGNSNSTSQTVGQDQAATGGDSGSCYDKCGGSDGISQDQTGSNSNETSQEANASSETNQVNVNAPISILSWGSNNGDVHQSNEAGTFVGASNENETTQSVAQDQSATSGGSDHPSCGCGHDGGDISQDQNASNDNATYQEANAAAETNQVNVNAPISILSWGSNNGDVWQSNDAVTVVHAGNSNSTDQSIHQGQEATGGDGASGGDIWQSQTGSNQNETTQDANASATTNQENWNVPFSFLSFGSHGGDGCGCEGSGNDVWQSNDAFTVVHAGNANSTDQSIHQGQEATGGSVGDCVAECTPVPNPNPCGYECDPHPDPCGYECDPHPDPCGCDPKPKPEPKKDPCFCDPKPEPEPCGCTPPPCACAHETGISQSQTGSNANSTDQSANATASTDQQNVNRPVSVLSFGSGSGDVGQANDAGTFVGAGNANDTTQSVGQDQVAVAGEGGDAKG